MKLMNFLTNKFTMGFNVWGLIIFLLIMIPNLIWFGVKAPNDVLRVESATKTMDTIASVCQVMMVVFLCIFINKDCSKIGFDRKNYIAMVPIGIFTVCHTAYSIVNHIR